MGARSGQSRIADRIEERGDSRFADLQIAESRLRTPGDVAVHSLLTAVVLWARRPPSLQIDTISQPPRTQPGQTEQPLRGANGGPLSLRIAYGSP